jgi:N-acetylneuraminate synthase
MIIIGNRKIGAGDTLFVIAEMSVNHNKSLDQALEIAEAAVKNDSHAL